MVNIAMRDTGLQGYKVQPGNRALISIEPYMGLTCIDIALLELVLATMSSEKVCGFQVSVSIHIGLAD